MNVKIILTSYFLKFMYGDRAYDDPLLLSREIMKKAYNEGLYYISSNKNIDAVLKSNSKRTDSTGLTSPGSLTAAMDWDCPLPKIS